MEERGTSKAAGRFTSAGLCTSEGRFTSIGDRFTSIETLPLACAPQQPPYQTPSAQNSPNFHNSRPTHTHAPVRFRKPQNPKSKNPEHPAGATTAASRVKLFVQNPNPRIIRDCFRIF